MNDLSPPGGFYAPNTGAAAPVRVLALTVRADIGGGPEHLYLLARGVSERFEMAIACPDEPPFRARYATLDRVPAVLDLPHRAFEIRALRALAREIRTRRIDLIHSHGKGAGLYGRLLAMMTGRPCVHTFHGLHIGEYGPARLRLYLALERILGRGTAAAITVSQGELEKLSQARLLPAGKLVLVPNGVAIPETPAQPAPADDLRIVAVNRYDHQKNPELLLEIALNLRSLIGDGFRITVLGEGEKLPEMREKARAAGLERNLELAGPHDAPRTVFRRSDIFLSTSRWEGMPLAVLEAMSEGLPVVATDVVGNRDVVEDGRSGRLFPNEDGLRGAEAIASLGREERLVLGAAGRRMVADSYSVERMVADTEAVYERCLALP